MFGGEGICSKPEIDFNEIFSSVVRLTTIQIILAIAVVMDLKLKQMDVT